MKCKCPYCATEVSKKNIIDEGHSNLKNMSKKGNTKYVYLCPYCNEVFEAFQKRENLLMPVDRYFDRKFQYCHGNLEKAEYWKF